MSLLEDLNPGQRNAVVYNDGPQMVIAGAGSGKTRVLTYKIAYLLEQGMNPWNILALTFTNKAATEMKVRIGNLVGQDRARHLNMGTFHSVFSHILRVEAASLGYNSSFTIYDETDSRSLIKTIVKEMGLDDKVYKPSDVHHRISMAKNHLISAEAYQANPARQSEDAAARKPELGRIFVNYCERCRQANAMDFDDLLVLTYRLFEEHPDVCEKYAGRFEYVLVDEYQDTNYAQQCIVYQLTRERQRVCVVGDDAQSIYGFRGANLDNMLDFQKLYKEAQLFKLEQNYRSTQRIVQAANSLIKHNERQIPKDVFSENDEGEKLKVMPAYSDKEEALIVCKEIKRIKREDRCEYADFVVLYRTNSQSRSFEEEMGRQHIPYRIYGGMNFYQRKEIKDIVAYFRLVVNPDDEEAIKRIINYPARGIGNTTVQKIAACARLNHVSFWQVIGEPAAYGLDVNRGTVAKLDAFRSLIEGFIEQSATTDVYTLGKEIVKASGISADIFSSSDPEALARQDNLGEFLSSMNEFVEEKQEADEGDAIYLSDFLQDIALLTDLDSSDNDEPKVALMTIHAAKGLEFPTVFIVGLEENIFPSPRSCNSLRELEEERRLLYVAITRAEKHCFMTYARNRMRYGQLEFDTPSRFLRDIDGRFVQLMAESEPSEAMSRYAGRRTRGRFGGLGEDDYSPNKPYMGSHRLGEEYRQYGSRMQNANPVASQFRADPKPKVTQMRRPEVAVDPLSERTKQRLAMEHGNMRRLEDAITSGGRGSAQGSQPAASAQFGIAEGDVIEHQRFGIGTILKIEGAGESTKATVDFKNAGQKQLLLKFARFTKVR